MFWLGFALAAVTLAVWGIVAYLLLMGWQVPVILQAPRPQFMVLLFSVPAIAQACASGSSLLVCWTCHPLALRTEHTTAGWQASEVLCHCIIANALGGWRGVGSLRSTLQ